MNAGNAETPCSKRLISLGNGWEDGVGLDIGYGFSGFALGTHSVWKQPIYPLTQRQGSPS